MRCSSWWAAISPASRQITHISGSAEIMLFHSFNIVWQKYLVQENTCGLHLRAWDGNVVKKLNIIQYMLFSTTRFITQIKSPRNSHRRKTGVLRPGYQRIMFIHIRSKADSEIFVTCRKKKTRSWCSCASRRRSHWNFNMIQSRWHGQMTQVLFDVSFVVAFCLLNGPVVFIVHWFLTNVWEKNMS